jgi:hypothetical protein
VPEAVPFGAITVGGPPGEVSIVVTASEPVEFEVDLLDDGGGAFVVVDEPCEWAPQVAVGWACSIPVVFTPPDVASYAGVVSVQAAGEPGPRQVALTGEGVAVLFTVQAEMPTFPDTVVGAVSGPQPLMFDASAPVAFTFSIGVLPDEFDAASECGWAEIDSETHRCTVDVWFSPVSLGAQEGQLWILPPEPNATFTPVFLRGTGISGGGID